MHARLSRRRFLNAAALGMATAILTRGVTARAATRRTGTGRRDPDIIIDTHTHFYDPTRPQGVPWPAKEETLLYRTVLPKDYKAQPTPQPVTGTVVVEASAWVEDNQWILDLAASDPFIVGLVGNLPVGTDGFRAHLKRFAANKLFRGLRLGVGRVREGLAQKQFMADLRSLAKHDLALDVLGGPDALPDVARLAKTIPDLRIVIDHVANLRIDGRAPPADWFSGMQTAAGHKNVFCKVSGLVEGTGRADGTAPQEVEFYRPVLDAVWAAFGEDRLIYGSNWPVSERFATLATVQRIASDYFSAKRSGVRDKVFWKNAKTVYKWIRP
ncbi:MAG: amidohydrolase family protein [Verrucomicrobia bacterium]|nr:amidohydrolase family protein [Verrucomicrobiota bacterium]